MYRFLLCQRISIVGRVGGNETPTCSPRMTTSLEFLIAKVISLYLGLKADYQLE